MIKKMVIKSLKEESTLWFHNDLEKYDFSGGELKTQLYTEPCLDIQMCNPIQEIISVKIKFKVTEDFTIEDVRKISDRIMNKIINSNDEVLIIVLENGYYKQYQTYKNESKINFVTPCIKIEGNVCDKSYKKIFEEINDFIEQHKKDLSNGMYAM
ncbi:hypothetical protein [Peptostreptococcus faecalis]|uniref:hypothetical protein n=1 Tax=Peptostreptococcus faecalis TaxID=2045015 RepID=UPI000C7D7A05|nr:hypothetical protein [Peptostreptococcus faecalis]